MQFTKDTSKVLASIYKLYLEKRKNGQSKEDAMHFDADFWHNVEALSSYSESDISTSLHELKNAEFVKCYISGDFKIENALIVQMENRFKDGAAGVAKYLLDLVANAVSGLSF